MISALRRTSRTTSAGSRRVRQPEPAESQMARVCRASPFRVLAFRISGCLVKTTKRATSPQCLAPRAAVQSLTVCWTGSLHPPRQAPWAPWRFRWFAGCRPCVEPGAQCACPRYVIIGTIVRRRQEFSASGCAKLRRYSRVATDREPRCCLCTRRSHKVMVAHFAHYMRLTQR